MSQACFVRAALAAALVGALVAPTPAHACGGFFCSNATQPVDQSGEQILFSVDADGSVTAVVQIAYTGPAASFAWIVPVPAVPELSTGTNTLFDALASATGVTFATTSTTEGTCHAFPACIPRRSGSSSGGCGMSSSDSVPAPAASDAGTRGVFDAAATGADSGGGGVTVLAREAVGPYDVVVLEGVDTPAINSWLTANDYFFPPGAVEALDPYVAQGSKFVTLRLSKDAIAGDLVPLVMRYTSGEPCIPIRLTAIATVPNMPITAYFLADGDVRTDGGYVETQVPDDVRFWRGMPEAYWEVLNREVDRAGGHAFVPEYRGPVPSIQLAGESIEDLRTQTDPKLFLSALATRNFVGDTRLLGILSRFLPPPPGDDARTFFNCLISGCGDYDAYLATIPFDPNALVDALNTAIVEPRASAEALLHRHTRLTRLTTTMSAAEMTVDPTFRVEAAGRDISNVRNATLVSQCSEEYLEWDAPQVLRMPSGTEASWTPGRPYEGDAEFCGSYGMVPEGSASARGEGSCSCRLAGGATDGWPAAIGVTLAMLAIGGLRRRRRRARAR